VNYLKVLASQAGSAPSFQSGTSTSVDVNSVLVLTVRTSQVQQNMKTLVCQIKHEENRGFNIQGEKNAAHVESYLFPGPLRSLVSKIGVTLYFIIGKRELYALVLDFCTKIHSPHFSMDPIEFTPLDFIICFPICCLALLLICSCKYFLPF